MGNAFTLMVICGILLTILGIVFRRPLLYLFGASDSTYPYAESYMTIYLLGSVFVMMGLGMNAFINSQGFGRIGMQTVLLGAVAQHHPGPCVHFRFSHGCPGSSPGHYHFPVFIGGVGAEVPGSATGASCG